MFRENVDGNEGCTVLGDEWLIDGCKAFDNARHGIRVDGADCIVSDPEANGNGGNPVQNNGTRMRLNGVIELDGPPTASNYDETDAGVTIYDTSASPWDEYVVGQDGSVEGPV